MTLLSDMADDFADLLQECAQARAAGLDFPSIWHTILRYHPAVAGGMRQRASVDGVWLEVPLRNGQHLKCAGDGYSLLGQPTLVFGYALPVPDVKPNRGD
jgi:hypothetical protein